VKHIAIKISGNVQGVFFRASTKDIAEKLRIKGFVRNEKDGSVYIEAEGEEKTLKIFMDWCQHGPPHARVENVSVVEGGVQHFSKFEINR
jgi:acylphosphatase